MKLYSKHACRDKLKTKLGIRWPNAARGMECICRKIDNSRCLGETNIKKITCQIVN